MNDAQLAFWNDYVRSCADLLGLKDRQVTVKREGPTDEKSLAYIWCHFDVVHAYIYLSVDFLIYSEPEKQRATVAHELLHIHTAPAHERVCWALEFIPETDLTRALESVVRTETEQLTDRLSYILAPLLPLPEGAPNGTH